MRLERDNFLVSIVILISSVSLVAISIARGFAHWEMAKEQFIVARVALDDSIQLLQADFRRQKRRSASSDWLSARSKAIFEVKKGLIKIDEKLKILGDSSSWEKVFFEKGEMATAKNLVAIWSMKRQELILRAVIHLDDCQD